MSEMMTISTEHYENLLRYIKNLEDIKDKNNHPYKEAFRDYLSFMARTKKDQYFEKANEVAMNQILVKHQLVITKNEENNLVLMKFDEYMFRLWELDDIIRIE